MEHLHLLEEISLVARDHAPHSAEVDGADGHLPVACHVLRVSVHVVQRADILLVCGLHVEDRLLIDDPPLLIDDTQATADRRQ